MDDGHVIPALNEEWTFAGAKIMEWIAGVVSAFLVSTAVEKPAHWMPLLVLIMIGSTLMLSTLRRRFPDEERGVANLFMTGLGFAPPGIPIPAKLQPRWSGGRISTLKKNSMYMQLELDEVVHMAQYEPKRR